MFMLEMRRSGSRGSSESSRFIRGSFPAIPALAITTSILWVGECESAVLKAESWEDQDVTSHLQYWTLFQLVIGEMRWREWKTDFGKAVSSLFSFMSAIVV